MSGNNIKVVCRFRPQNKLEIKEGGVPIIELNDEGTSVTLKVKIKTSLPLQSVYSFLYMFILLLWLGVSTV